MYPCTTFTIFVGFQNMTFFLTIIVFRLIRYFAFNTILQETMFISHMLWWFLHDGLQKFVTQKARQTVINYTRADMVINTLCAIQGVDCFHFSNNVILYFVLHFVANILVAYFKNYTAVTFHIIQYVIPIWHVYWCIFQSNFW